MKPRSWDTIGEMFKQTIFLDVLYISKQHENLVLFCKFTFLCLKKKIINNIPNINLFSVLYKKLKVFLVYVDTSKWIQNNVLYCIFIYKYIQKLYTFETQFKFILRTLRDWDQLFIKFFIAIIWQNIMRNFSFSKCLWYISFEGIAV